MDIITLFSNRMPRLKSWIERSFPFIGRTMNARRERIRKQAYQEYGVETARQFDECMQRYGHRYMLGFGTLLGAVREKGFIKHDMDLDVCMWIDDFQPEMIAHLKEYGFEWLYSYQIDGGRLGREDTFDYKGCRIDIFKEGDDVLYANDFVHKTDMAPGRYMPRRLELPYVRETRRVPFESLMLPIPVNAEEQMRVRYGDDYMVPNPQFDSQRLRTCLREWPEMVEHTRHLTYPSVD